MGAKNDKSHVNLSHADITKLIETSDSEEVSEQENHTSDEIGTESSECDFNTNNPQMNYKERNQSKILEIMWQLNPLPHFFQSTAAYITKITPGGS
ncbi:hypothetical protein TNCV_1028661 [Trichonephila clavipes]|nr:hypothetical protein TNCV_1028661 [Trichonephila clavipes]